MNKISCDVCLDLLPLVKDEVASVDSEELVNEHIMQCDSCKAIYHGEKIGKKSFDDEKVTKKLKSQLMFCLITTVLFGVSVGIMITDGMNMFYNVVIMPAIGGCGYMFLRRKAYYAPIAVLLFSVGWSAFSSFTEEGMGGDYIYVMLASSLFYSLIYMSFCIIGIVIAWSLCYAFSKEEK